MYIPDIVSIKLRYQWAHRSWYFERFDNLKSTPMLEEVSGESLVGLCLSTKVIVVWEGWFSGNSDFGSLRMDTLR